MPTPQIVIEPRPLAGAPAGGRIDPIADEPAPRKRRRFLRFIGWLLLVFVLWSGWACYALFDLNMAVESGDPVALERRVDWIAVRQGLYGDLHSRLGTAKPGDPAIEELSSEHGVTALIRLARFNERGWDIAGAPEGKQGIALDLYRIRYAFFTGGPFAFRVDVRPAGDAVKRSLVLLFKWRGDWQLTRVLLPADAFGAKPAAAQTPAPARATPAAAPEPQTPPLGTQRAILYEEDSSDPNGKRYTGWVSWRTERVTPPAGGPPDLAVVADVKMPERPLNMTMTIRRNLDRSLPASHTIDLKFDVPANAASGEILDVAAIQMKPNEETAGQQLAGSRVKVSKDIFLMGLSAIDIDARQNLQILKERPWIGIAFVYKSNNRAVLSIEKGEAGDKVIGEALAQWASAPAADAGAPKR